MSLACAHEASLPHHAEEVRGVLLAGAHEVTRPSSCIAERLAQGDDTTMTRACDQDVCAFYLMHGPDRFIWRHVAQRGFRRSGHLSGSTRWGLVGPRRGGASEDPLTRR